jgi:O-antigen ligase
LRTAFLKEGLRALRGHLLGTEINRNAFKNLVTAQYGTAGMCCAHNGLVDLGISAGVPAMILWCAFLYGLYRIGRQTLRERRDIIGFALMLLVIGFGVRMFLDSTLRDHIILQFMLCAGLLMGACLAPHQITVETKVDQ